MFMSRLTAIRDNTHRTAEAMVFIAKNTLPLPVSAREAVFANDPPRQEVVVAGPALGLTGKIFVGVACVAAIVALIAIVSGTK